MSQINKNLIEIKNKISEKFSNNEKKKRLNYFFDKIYDNLDENIDENLLKNQFTSFIDSGMFEFLFTSQNTLFVLRKINFQIHSLHKLIIDLRQKVNFIQSDELALKALYLMLNRLFLDHRYERIADFLYAFKTLKKIDDVNFQPKIEVKLQLKNQNLKLCYDFNGGNEKYSINDKTYKNKESYYYDLIKILKINDYPRNHFDGGITQALTVLKLIRESLFLDFQYYNSNSLITYYGPGINLFFQNQNNRALQIIIQTLIKVRKKKNSHTLLLKEDLKLAEIKLRNHEKVMKNFEPIGENFISEYEDKPFFDVDLTFEPANELLKQRRQLRDDLISKENERAEFNITKKALDKQRLKNNQLKIQSKTFETRLDKAMRKYNQLTTQQEKFIIHPLILKEERCFCSNDLPKETQNFIMKTGQCPICGKQFQTGTMTDELQHKITQEKRNISILRNKFLRIEQEIQKNEKDISKLEGEFLKLESKLYNSIDRQELIELNDKIAELQTFIKRGPDFLEARVRINKSLNEIKLADTKISLKKEEKKVLDEEINLLNNIVSIAETKVQDTQYQDKLDKKFYSLQEDIYHTDKTSKIIIKKLGKFRELGVELNVDREKLRLAYYFSTLKLSLINQTKDFNTFFNFPFLYINGISGKNLSEFQNILKEFNKSYNNFQIIIPISENLKLDSMIQDEYNIVKPKKASVPTLDKWFKEPEISEDLRVTRLKTI